MGRRRYLCLTLALSACRIEDAHFTGSDAAEDAAFFDAPEPPVGHAFVADEARIYTLDRQLDGTFALGASSYEISNTKFIAIDRGHRALYAISDTATFTAFQITSEGVLQANPNFTITSCTSTGLAVAPDSTMLAIGCANGFLLGALGSEPPSASSFTLKFNTVVHSSIPMF